MTSGEVCATDDFWNQVEAQVRCTIPTYVKNLLRLRGYDNALSVKALTDEDLKSLETFARTKMWMYIPPGANDKDYYHMFSSDPESFEILPGHVKMLKEIAKQVDVIAHDSATSVYTVSRTSSEINNSSQEGDIQLHHSSKEERDDSIVPCKTQRDDIPQTGATVIKEQEPFKAFIVDGSPEQFYIQLESNQSELDRIEALLKPAPTWAVFNKKLIGQMCAALFDGCYYRGIILSSDDKGATVHYIDYGNKAISTDLRKLPDNLQHLKRLAILCRLESKHGTFSPRLIEKFESLSRDDVYEMKFVSMESNPAVVQLFVDGLLFAENEDTMSVPALNGFDKQFDDIAESNKKFDEILDKMSELVVQNLPSTHLDETPSTTYEVPKFACPTSLKDGDLVVIRYVESPTLFSVQLTTSIAEYDAMMDRLCDYCPTAPTILKPQIGMACAASYKNDSEWYRAEILNIGRKDALTRFVDYGIELRIEINKLKEIGNEFLLMPKQAIPCCILGFESLKATRTVIDKFEFLAEHSNGDRRKFQVSTFGTVNGTILVNLVDVKAVPVLDLSMRLMQLSLPQEKFREFRQQALQKRESTRQSTTQSARESTPQSTIQSARESTPQSTIQSARESTSQSARESTTQSTSPISDCRAIPNSRNSSCSHDLGSSMQDIDIDRLVGQTVLAKIVSFQDPNSFQIVIYGCETTFAALYHKTSSSSRHFDTKLPKGATIPIRIESVLVRKVLSVTPLIGETSSSLICNLPFFSNNFQVYVMHWEAYNVAYVQSLTALGLVESLLNELFEFYDESDGLLQECDIMGDQRKVFAPGTLCAVKSSDENWYRAEIISDTQSDVNVRYLDYGNCESIPKSLVKRLDSKFFNTPALAVKVYLPLQKVYSDRETSVDEIVKLTAGISLDLKVLEFCDRSWIVDMFIDDDSITTTIKQKNCCKSMSIDDLKKQIAHIETLQKVARLQARKEKENQDVKSTPAVANNVRSDPVPPKSAPASVQRIQPANEHKPNYVNDGKISKANAYIIHVNRPDRFYLQMSSISTALDELREEIQIVAPSLPPLEDFSTDTRCIARYSVDNQWYRATIIDSGSGVTSILFIDYGNTDTITDNSLIKATTDAFDQLPAFAIPCALPLEPKDRMEWSQEACEVLTNLMDRELEFEYVCKGKSNNLVNLYDADRDIMQELIWAGHAIKLESIRSGTNCYVSHINSISDFYIQMESDVDTLRKVADYLLDVSKFEVMRNIKEGLACAARDPHDKLWYRARVLSCKANATEVFFVDYGYSTMTTELRILPTPIANAPSLAKHCSMVKPKEIPYWPERAERLFAELTDGGAIFIVEVLSPGKKSTINLLVDHRSILEEISPVCDNYSANQLETTIESSDSAAAKSEIFKAFIILGSPSEFYIQIESDSSKLDEMWYALEHAYSWPALGEVVVGQMCAALFDGNFYRAKILSLGRGGALVHYVDYGNQSFSTDLRQLPENLKHHRHLTICCCLESKYGTFSSQMIERFEKLSRDDTYEIRFISQESSPAIVQLFVQGEKF
ncbi:maternal protein tudor-like isoform X2 [Bradysia coprophila]|uniref:maternal protein tudor-like isoform X2 n=1 Tax=Bradysia coprophila TaxID=38358 RepID=UPI00187D8B09|nr:maternal protein tudor-like isoform X2 [Bradysia coprophila]